jgi:hypothetical protein
MPQQYQVPNLPKFGKGLILLDLLDASDNPTGYFSIGNATKTEVDPGVTLEQLEQSMNRMPGVIAEAPKSIKPTITITGTDFKARNLQVALAAAGIAPLDVTIGDISGEMIASASVTKKGKYFPLANRSVDPTTLVLTQSEPATVMTFDQVATGDGEAIYFYSSYTGPAPRVGDVFTAAGFVASSDANNVSGMTILAASGGAAGEVTVALTTQVPETHAGTGTTSGATTLTEGTDYILEDGNEALAYFPTTSTVDDAVAVVAAYSTVVGHFLQIAGASVPFIRCRIRFCPDPTDGQKMGYEVWKTNLTPSSPMGLIEDTYGNWAVKGSILDDSANHPTCPYYLVTVPKDTN